MSDWLFIGGNKIHKTAIVLDNVEMGTGNTIYPYATLGLLGFIRGQSEETRKVILGNNNKIGAHASIMTGKNKDTVIGSDNMIMNYVNIGHDVKIGNNNEVGAKTLIAGFTEIGNDNKIKVCCTFRNRIIIGDGNLIGMSSVITKSFPKNNKIIYGAPGKIQSGTKRVLGVGLPRTGTSSLSQSLDILGYSGEHYCLIHGLQKTTGAEAKRTYEINNSCFLYLEKLIAENPEAYFILTVRDKEDWERSVNKFGLTGMPDINDYSDKCLNLFEKLGMIDKLLIIDITTEDEVSKWIKICNFLDEDLPSKFAFPHINLKEGVLK